MMLYRAKIAVLVAVFFDFSFSAPLAAAQEPGFAPSITYRTGGFQPTSVALADVNGDGRPAPEAGTE